MFLVHVKRNTKTEKRYTKKMGILWTKVTYIKRYILGMPVKTLHKYRRTYYGAVKDCKECELSK